MLYVPLCTFARMLTLTGRTRAAEGPHVGQGWCKCEAPVRRCRFWELVAPFLPATVRVLSRERLPSFLSKVPSSLVLHGSTTALLVFCTATMMEQQLGGNLDRKYQLDGLR